MKTKKLVLPAALLLILLASGCDDGTSGNKDIVEITITNIPANIFVWDSATNTATTIFNPTFRVYINASNSMEPDDAPEAKGLIQVTPQMLQPNGTYTVTIPLQNPNPGFGQPGYNANPNIDTGPWSGTARYFSIMLSPQNTMPYQINAIVARGVTNLDRGKSTIRWDRPTYINFRGQTSPDMIARYNALFYDILWYDPQVITN